MNEIDALLASGLPKIEPRRLAAVYAEICCRSYTLPLLLSIVNGGRATFIKRSQRVDTAGMTARQYGEVWDTISAYTQKRLRTTHPKTGLL